MEGDEIIALLLKKSSFLPKNFVKDYRKKRPSLTSNVQDMDIQVIDNASHDVPKRVSLSDSNPNEVKWFLNDWINSVGLVLFTYLLPILTF